METNRTDEQNKNRELYQAGKEKPCAMCGEWHPYFVMEYHHIADRAGARKPGYGLTQYCRGTKVDEIPSCIAVCANCHRIIHWAARMETGKEEREKTMWQAWRKYQEQKRIEKKEGKITRRTERKATRIVNIESAKNNIFDCVPESGAIPKNDLIVLARKKGIGINKARDLIKMLITAGRLCEHKEFRAGTNARIDLSRAPVINFS